MNLRPLEAVVALGCAATICSQTPGDAFRKRPVVVSNRIQVFAELTQSPFRVGQPVEIAIRLKNVSPTSVRVGDSDPAVDFELVVTDAAGSEPPRTEYGKRAFNIWRSPFSARQPWISTRTGGSEQLGCREDLSIEFGILPSPGGVEKAFSNLEQFTVVP
jgi:hypothetical protein